MQWCYSDECRDKDWCVNRKCSLEKDLERCADCEEDCRKGLLEKLRPYGSNLFIRRYGEETLLDCLERNERGGVMYHCQGLEGDYDGFTDSEEQIRSIQSRKMNDRMFPYKT